MGIELLVIAILIVLNGVFVAAEIALVSIRRSRVEQLVDEGRRGSNRVRALKGDPGRFHALFGRDSLITALQVLPAAPQVAPERQIPPSLVDVVMKALSKDAKDRYQDAHEYAEALKQALAFTSRPPRPSLPVLAATTIVCPSCGQPRHCTVGEPHQHHDDESPMRVPTQPAAA